jgi:GLPGLI family protein
MYLKSIFTLAILLASILLNHVFAQNFSGEVVYQSKTMMKDNFKIEMDGATPEMMKSFEEDLKKAFEKTYTLKFNAFEGFFSEEQQIENDAKSGSFQIINSSGNEKSYHNLKDKQSIREIDFLSKEFLIIDSLKKWNWVLTEETKKIGQYTAIKAICTIKVSEEALRKFEEMKEKQANSNSQIMVLTPPKERQITAWFTPEIPVSLGPDSYWGLPGLILEVHDANTIWLCSKVTLNPKEGVKIEKPKKGQRVNEKEYQDLVAKKLESMKNGNGTIEFRIGG